ncbi:hypothetical protein RV02_GL002031 [Enterococcus gilvus]|nr:hypothetical protein RV02_GL002031 [Enterococcus gilvus]
MVSNLPKKQKGRHRINPATEDTEEVSNETNAIFSKNPC